ncbi:hypothetical protein [Peribacillus muralis]
MKNNITITDEEGIVEYGSEAFMIFMRMMFQLERMAINLMEQELLFKMP